MAASNHSGKMTIDIDGHGITALINTMPSQQVTNGCGGTLLPCFEAKHVIDALTFGSLVQDMGSHGTVLDLRLPSGYVCRLSITWDTNAIDEDDIRAAFGDDGMTTVATFAVDNEVAPFAALVGAVSLQPENAEGADADHLQELTRVTVPLAQDGAWLENINPDIRLYPRVLDALKTAMPESIKQVP